MRPTRRAVVAGPVLAPLAAGAEPRWVRRSRHGRVEVWEHEDGVVELRLDGAPQSAWHPAHPDELVYAYSRALVGCLARTPLAEAGDGRALVVGLGGGTVCRALRTRWPGVEVHVVELNPAVVRAARRFFALDAEVVVHVGDGRAHLERAPGPWDLVVLDAATEHGVPEALQTLEFLERIAAVLAPSGVVLANSWRFAPSAAAESATWLAVFPGVTERLVEPPEENRILAAGPGWRPGDDDRPVGAPSGAPVLRDP